MGVKPTSGIDMRSTFVRLLVAALIGLATPASAQKEATRWQTATVLSAELNGYGTAPSAKSKSSRGDIWWTYRVSTDTMTYTGVLRESPTKTGMKTDSKIRVSVVKGRMNVCNVAGKRYVLKVIRQTEGSSYK
jgi:hypothetical protein